MRNNQYYQEEKNGLLSSEWEGTWAISKHTGFDAASPDGARTVGEAGG